MFPDISKNVSSKQPECMYIQPSDLILVANELHFFSLGQKAYGNSGDCGDPKVLFISFHFCSFPCKHEIFSDVSYSFPRMFLLTAILSKNEIKLHFFKWFKVERSDGRIPQ